MAKVITPILVALVAMGFATGCLDWSKTFGDDNTDDDTDNDTDDDTEQWHIYTIDSNGDVGEYTSIALDSNDRVHISYFDWTNYDLKYATNAEVE